MPSRDPRPSVRAETIGLALGCLAELVVGDPQRAHPVAAFGRAAQRLETTLYADSRARGVAYTALCTGVAVSVGGLGRRLTAGHPVGRALTTAAATWAVLGGTSLAAEGRVMAELLGSTDLTAARQRLSHLCARDPTDLDAAALARASVESLAENVSDAVVGPLLWGAVAGAPGLLGYRAVNTLDAMVGYRSPRYERFGWAAARLDDLVNLVPARVSALLIAGATGSGSAGRRALRVAARDGLAHPSPNAGYPEAAVAGALGLRLGGTNTYHGRTETRPVLGAGGREVVPADLTLVVPLVRRTTWLAMVGAVALHVALRRRPSPEQRTGRVGWGGSGGAGHDAVTARNRG